LRVTIDAQIHIENPSPEIMRWCADNLVLRNPDYDRKMRMGLWLGNTPEKLALYEQRGKEWILPYGTLRQLWPLIGDSDCQLLFQFPKIIAYRGKPIPLYEYQQEAVNDCYEKRYGILQSPAGSGKTQMGIALVTMWQRPALWLTHTADLLKQSKERAEMYLDPGMMGTITEGKVQIGEGITFATIQTMSKLDLERYKDLWDVVIVDECHHVAGTPTRVTQFSRVLNHLNARHKYGLSATVHRADGLIKATYAYLGEIIHTVPEEAVAEKIMKVGILPQSTSTGLSAECLNPDGTLSYTKLITYLTEDTSRNYQIIQDIVANRNHSCLILSERIDHLKMLMNHLPEEMRNLSTMVTGKMVSKAEKSIRENALSEMRNGTKSYLFATYSLAKEGLDIPRLDRLFMTTPVKDEAVVIQSVGRVARTSPGKGEPIVYDYIDPLPYGKRAWKERCRHYRKIGAYVK